MDPRTQRWLLLALLFTVAFVLYRDLGGADAPHSDLGSSSITTESPDDSRQGYIAADPLAANSTLGFGAIAAVSRAGSPRRESLLLAANITDLSITIPAQPQWTPGDIAALRADVSSTITRGSALAWLGHLNALRWFLSTDLETVLILEDDVDWDIHLRTSQIPDAASAIRRLTSPSSPPRSEGVAYWGDPTSWDILYLGHCGDNFPPTSFPPTHPHTSFPDPTLPLRSELHPWTAELLDSLQIPEHTRLVHASISPLCTFGFALTRPAARKLLYEVADREVEGGTMAYDVRVLEACRDLGFRCWSANPELFHHLDAESEIAGVNTHPDGDEGGGQEDGRDGKDGGDRVEGLSHGRTHNIKCGARGMSFFTREGRTVEYLREVVGRQGSCLRDVEEG